MRDQMKGLIAVVASMLVWTSSQTTPAKERSRAREAAGNYSVGENVLISGDRPKSPHVESHIAANPKDPKHLVAASIAYTRTDGRSVCAVFSSFDKGKTWTRATLPTLDELDVVLAAIRGWVPGHKAMSSFPAW